MKHLQFPFLSTRLVFALLVLPALAWAQEYQIDWGSEGFNAFTGSWSLHSISTGVLIPGSPLPPTFSGPGYELRFTVVPPLREGGPTVYGGPARISRPSKR